MANSLEWLRISPRGKVHHLLFFFTSYYTPSLASKIGDSIEEQ
jgi:hypothetical protein